MMGIGLEIVLGAIVILAIGIAYNLKHRGPNSPV
jgi:hypothetical protein